VLDNVPLLFCLSLNITMLTVVPRRFVLFDTPKNIGDEKHIVN
jgi:hypothetical protein